ncbi:MAG: methyltransferase domain-containing protein, partial [Mangrovicoccus sp.]
MGVGQDISASNAGWTFGENVPETFVEHITQSVPLYQEGHELICQLSDFFVHNDSLIYEIGTSTGELIAKMAQHNASKPDARWVGIDVEEAMAAKAAKHCEDIPNIRVLHDDARFMDFEAADMVVSYYTM